MAISSLPAPNALMLCGDGETIAMHGKKLAVFPDYWWEKKTYGVSEGGNFGGVSWDGFSTQTVTWRKPVEPEPEIENSTNHQIIEISLPPVYIAPRILGETDEDFHAFVALCEQIYGVTFLLDDGADGGAVAEVPGGGWECENVLPGCLVATWNVTSAAEEGDSVATAVQKHLGNGTYVLAIAFKKPAERFYKDNAGTWIDKYRYHDSYSTAEGADCQVVGRGVYTKDGRRVVVSEDAYLRTRLLVSYRTINRNNPTIYTTAVTSTYAYMGDTDGVLASVSGNPTKTITQ